MLEASPCLCIYLMMDGHKHHAVAVESGALELFRLL